MCDDMKLYWLTALLIVVGGIFPASPVHTIGSDQVVSQGEILVVRAVPTLYPTLPAVAGESGTAVVEVKIKSDGSVAEATTVEGHALFKAVAENRYRSQ